MSKAAYMPSIFPAKGRIKKMKQWQANFARSMIFFAIALVIVAVQCAAELWMFHDKSIALYHRDPITALYSVGGLLFAIGACLWAAVMCVRIRRDMLRHDKKMKEMKQSTMP